jgi:hypothetical protein
VNPSTLATSNYVHTGVPSPRPDGSGARIEPAVHLERQISAYDSPELATLLGFTAQQARWRVASGGRIGFVIGEDAIQGGCRP